MLSVAGKPSIEYQPRDLAILRGLLDSRVATIRHLSLLHFEGRLEAARKRVQKLKAAGVIHERPRRSADPSIYCLNRRAFAILEQHGILADYPKVGWSNLEKRSHVSEFTIRHELEVMDVKSALTAAAAKSRLTIVEFSTWPKLHQFVASHPVSGEMLVKPDGFIRMHGADSNSTFERIFFLEVDRSTEEQAILAERAEYYRDFYERGGLASRFGQPRSEFKQFPFVVLMTFKTAERRNNTAERLLLRHPPIRNQVWLTTLKEVTTDPLAPIWVKPGEYLRITTGTPFDLKTHPPLEPYRSRPEREAFIEQNIPRHRLLAAL